MSATDDEVRNLIYSSCETLDRRDFEGFLGMCAEQFRYRVSAFVPEAGRELTWFDQSRSDLEVTFKNLPQHVRLPGEYFRQATVQRISRSDGVIYAVTSVLAVYTDDDGVSRLFAAGRYQDSLVVEVQRLKLRERHTVLQTRDLGGGSHIPI